MRNLKEKALEQDYMNNGAFRLLSKGGIERVLVMGLEGVAPQLEHCSKCL